MKVSIISCTQNPVDVLLFTKNTRLNMIISNMDNIRKMSKKEKDSELDYMVNTIRSSWEFVDYTFLIEDVTRAFTHQLVRNRHGSYAQQTMRIIDVSGFDFHTGPSIINDQKLLSIYCDCMEYIEKSYKKLIDNGAEIEDARGLLPTNICTNIVAKYNLRTLAEIISARSSMRTQSEYRDFVQKAYRAIVDIHPWASRFLNSHKHSAAELLQEFIVANCEDKLERTNLIKAIDLLRK